MGTQEARRQFLEERRQGLGGSDIAAIMGLDHFRDQHDVWRSKVEPAVDDDDGELGPRARGRYLEPVIRQLYGAITGRRVTEVQQRIVDPDISFLHANLDAEVEGPAGLGLLEAKAPGLNRFSQMKREGVPREYFIQIQHYLGVTGREFAAFAALNAERWDLLHFDVERDDVVITETRKFAAFWWNEYVVTKKPPPLDSEAPAVKLPEEQGSVVTLETPEFRAAMERWTEAREVVALADGLKTAADDEVKALIEACGAGIVEGAGHRVYYTETAGRKSFKKDRLAAAQPLDSKKVIKALAKAGFGEAEIHSLLDKTELDLEQYHEIGKPSRPLRVFPLNPKRGET